MNLNGRHWSHDVFSFLPNFFFLCDRTGLATFLTLHICFPLSVFCCSPSSYKLRWSQHSGDWALVNSGNFWWRCRLLEEGEDSCKSWLLPLMSNLALLSSTSMFSLSHLYNPPTKPISRGPFITQPIPPHRLC